MAGSLCATANLSSSLQAFWAGMLVASHVNFLQNEKRPVVFSLLNIDTHPWFLIKSDWFFLYSLVSLYPRHRALAYFRLWGTTKRVSKGRTKIGRAHV